MTANTSRPNIVLITTDQQRFDAVGGTGPACLETPHIDALRDEGITFTRAYADCPVCVPSRITIMTGRSALSHGVTGNAATSRVIDRNTSLPSCLRSAGYQTAAIGKMHFGPQRTRHGFEEMILPDDYYRQMRRSGTGELPMRHGLGQNGLEPTRATTSAAQSLTTWTAQQCADYIQHRRDPMLPFFLWCSFSKPHPPLDPPAPYDTMYADAPIPPATIGAWRDDPAQCPTRLQALGHHQNANAIEPHRLHRVRAAYYGLVSHIDHGMGLLFAALNETGLLSNTLIMFTSDHGEMLGDHRLIGKTVLHEPSAHVPMVMRLPETWRDRRCGTCVHTPVTLTDLLPTLVRAADGAVPQHVTGNDMLSLSETPSSDVPRYAHMIAGADANHIGVTDGRWKYLYFPEGPCEQLFDLARDPLEQADQSGLADAGAVRDRMRQAMLAEHRQWRTAYVRNEALIQQPALEKLRADAARSNRLKFFGFRNDEADADTRH